MNGQSDWGGGAAADSCRKLRGHRSRTVLREVFACERLMTGERGNDIRAGWHAVFDAAANKIRGRRPP